MTNGGPYSRLIALLDSNEASYRMITHEPEGRTEAVSPMRGNPLAAAAKCMVVMVKTGKKHKTFVLAVVPGDRLVDLEMIKVMKGGNYAGFASPDVAEELAGSEMGTVLPFAMDNRLELIVDPGLLQHQTIYFNAGRLDRSVALDTSDFVRIARPHIAAISKAAAANQFKLHS